MITRHVNFINTRHALCDEKYSPVNPGRWDYSSRHYSSEHREEKYSLYFSSNSLLVNYLPLRGDYPVGSNPPGGRAIGLIGTSGAFSNGVTRNRGLLLATGNKIALHYKLHCRSVERKAMNSYAYISIPTARRESKFVKRNRREIGNIPEFSRSVETSKFGFDLTENRGKSGQQ